MPHSGSGCSIAASPVLTAPRVRVSAASLCLTVHELTLSLWIPSAYWWSVNIYKHQTGDVVDQKSRSKISHCYVHATETSFTFSRARSRVRNIYGNAVTPAFPLARHTFVGTPFPCKNIYGNGVPMRSRPTTPLLVTHERLVLGSSNLLAVLIT